MLTYESMSCGRISKIAPKIIPNIIKKIAGKIKGFGLQK
jgi:hypothetical protein